MFGYVFRELVVADRRLQFGWRSSPGFFCLFSATLEHAHRPTLYDDAVSPFFVLYYVDDGILVEVQWWPDGRSCRRASASLASDHYWLFGVRSSRDPTLLSPHKISLWDTRLCVLGWDIDTVAMTISAVSYTHLRAPRD